MTNLQQNMMKSFFVGYPLKAIFVTYLLDISTEEAHMFFDYCPEFDMFKLKGSDKIWKE